MSINPRLTASYTLDDSLVVYGDNTYAYNNDGYLQTKTTPVGTTTYTYGTRGELKEVVTPAKTITYKHNALNQRVAKLINGEVVEKYLWADLTTLLAVYDANDNLIQRFEYADGRMPVAMTQGSIKYYLHYDQVGSLRAISRVLSPDNTTKLVKEITYDTYGNILSDTNPSLKVPFGFAGGLYDADTKLTRFGYRDYDAYVGKWTAKDPIGFDGGDSNLYGYVLQDPVRFFDPDGLINRSGGHGHNRNGSGYSSGSAGVGYGGGFMFGFGGANAHVQYLTNGTKQTIICGRIGLGLHIAGGAETSAGISPSNNGENCQNEQCSYSWSFGVGGDLHFANEGWGGSLASGPGGFGGIGDIPAAGLGLGAEGGLDACLVITCPIN